MTETARSTSSRSIRIGFVVHVMQVAGAEVLVAETIRRLRSFIDPVIFCLDAQGQLGDVLTTEGIPVVVLGRRPGLDFRCAREFAREIQRRDLDVLHAHQYTPFFYGGLAARWAGNDTRVLFTEHGRHYPDVVSWRRRTANRLVLKRLAHRVTAVCDFSRMALVQKDGFDLESIDVIPNGIDVERYEKCRDRRSLKVSLGLDPDRRYIVCIARFHPVKDHRTLISAFGDVASRSADTDLVLVGDGPLRSELETQVSELNLSKRVHFFGIRSEVPEILAAVDVFALSSVSEAASITLLEAMASGLPVVVTAVGGNPEIVRNGIDGFLVPRGDIVGLARALSSVLADREAATTMGTAGKDRVHEKFRLDETIGSYRAVYQGLADGRAAVRS